MTHFQAQRDAFLSRDDESIKEVDRRACTGCGSEFQPRRPWQRQCSHRCRQRTYVRRHLETPLGYYGA
jgi:hypothetical protein